MLKEDWKKPGQCRTLNTENSMKKCSFVASMIAILMITLSCQPSPNTNAGELVKSDHLKATVIRVIDGDTVEVRFDDGKTDKVRLLGVDTPETNAKNKPGEYGSVTNMDCLKAWGDKATTYAIDQLDKKEVVLVLDEDAGLRGYYGRLLAYVEVDGKDFNKSLVQLGYARVYEEGESKRESEYLRDQNNAQANSDGLWGC